MTEAVSAMYWLPRLQNGRGLGLPIPDTRVVPYDHAAIIAMLEDDGSPEAWLRLVNEVQHVANMVDYPVFLRTDIASAKHSGPSAYLALGNSHVATALSATIEDQEMHFPPRPTPSAFLVRRYLRLLHYFTAFDGLPIGREYRAFVNMGTMLCMHPYWPEDAVAEGNPSHENWREMMHVMYGGTQTPGMDTPLLQGLAEVAATKCGGYWSVDFAQDVDGAWWLIDMAPGIESWHPEGCPNAEGVKA